MLESIGSGCAPNSEARYGGGMPQSADQRQARLGALEKGVWGRNLAKVSPQLPLPPILIRPPVHVAAEENRETAYYFRIGPATVPITYVLLL